MPKQIKANGLPPDQLEITDAALHYITARYTREAGVRSLERQIGAVVRFKAVQWADIHDSPGNDDTMDHTGYKKHVDAKDVSEILGVEWWNPEERDSVGKRGVVNGLVVQGEGEGGLLSIETLLVPGTGRLRATGSLGGMLHFQARLHSVQMQLILQRSSKKVETWLLVGCASVVSRNGYRELTCVLGQGQSKCI